MSFQSILAAGKFDFLIKGISAFFVNDGWKMIVMFVIGAVLIYLGIKKEMEPALLIPMGFGAILVNIPFTGVLGETVIDGNTSTGILQWLFDVGIEASEALPLLLFIGIGAMIDFGPLLSNPKLLLFGGAAQFGIFATILAASAIGLIPGVNFSFADTVSIGIIGAADGPTAILVAMQSGTQYAGAIMVAAYSYMALVPIIQPPVIKLATTKKERRIRMEYRPASVSKATRIMFPIFVTVVAGLIAPASVALVGFLMFGNLIRECGVLNSLSETAQKVLANLVTIVLGLTISTQMVAGSFLRLETLWIMGLGIVAFVFDTLGGIFFAKFINLFSKKKVNPMIGAAGISAFPMASRVVEKLGQQEDKQNHLLMHAAGANVAGQIASVVAGGVILSMLVL